MIKPPIIIADTQDCYLHIFNIPSSAQSWVEAIDVISGEYIVYDSEGRLLSLEIRTQEKPGIFFGIGTRKAERITIELADEEPTHSKELREALVKYIKAIDTSYKFFEDKSLEQLIQKASEKALVK